MLVVVLFSVGGGGEPGLMIHPGFCAGSKDWSDDAFYGFRNGAGADFEEVLG